MKESVSGKPSEKDSEVPSKSDKQEYSPTVEIALNFKLKPVEIAPALIESKEEIEKSVLTEID